MKISHLDTWLLKVLFYFYFCNYYYFILFVSLQGSPGQITCFILHWVALRDPDNILIPSSTLMVGINFHSCPVHFTFIWKKMKSPFWQDHLISLLSLPQLCRGYLLLYFFKCRTKLVICLSICKHEGQMLYFLSPKQIILLPLNEKKHTTFSFSSEAFLCLCFSLCSITEELQFILAECLAKWSFLGMQIFFF